MPNWLIGLHRMRENAGLHLSSRNPLHAAEMRTASRIQTSASLLMASAFLGSEITAELLAQRPTTAWLWRLNLEVFRPFEYARLGSPLFGHLFGPYALIGGFVVACAILLAHLARAQWAIAFFANASFALAATLGYMILVGSHSARSASLVPSGSAVSLDGTLIAVLATTSFVAFCVSHWTFIRSVRSEWRSTRADRSNLSSSA